MYLNNKFHVRYLAILLKEMQKNDKVFIQRQNILPYTG